MDDNPNKKSLMGGVLNKDISDSELLLEIEVTDSLCSALLNENKKGESLVEVTIIQPDRLKTPSILASTPEHEKKKNEAQQQIDKKMNELIRKMKTLTKNPNNITTNDDETQKSMRQQFLATLGLKSLIEPKTTLRQKNLANQNYKNCASQTSNHLLENLLNPVSFKNGNDNKIEESKYPNLNLKKINSKTTPHFSRSNAHLSNTSTQTIDELTEPKFIKEKLINKHEQMNKFISIPVKLCSSQSQEFLKQFIKHFDDKKNENEIDLNSQKNVPITNSSVKPKKKANLLRTLSFIKIKKSTISFKKHNSKKLNKNKLDEVTIKKGDIFECLNHIPQMNTQQNFNMHITKEKEPSLKRNENPQENSMLRTISKLEDQLTSLPLEEGNPLWQISSSQECYHSRDIKSIIDLKENKVSSKGTHHPNTKLNCESDKNLNEHENQKSIQNEMNIQTYKQYENKPSSFLSKVNSDPIIESTSDWLTIDDENDESENRQKINSTCSFELPGGEQEQRRVDFIPDPWHPFCREHHGLHRDRESDLPSRRRHGTGAWTRPWSAPAPSSQNLPKGSVWFWDGSKLRPGYDLRYRVENILLNELGQNDSNEETQETMTRLPIHRLTDEYDMPAFMNNSSLSRIVELKQSLERPHLPPAPPLEEIAPSLKQKTSNKLSSSISQLRYVDLERDPPKRNPGPERQIHQQEYVALTAPPPDNSNKQSSHSTKSLHVTYLNPLLNRLSKKYQGPRSHSPHYDQPQSYEKQSKKSHHKRKNRSFRNDSDLNIPNSTGANLHEHHIYELMRTAQKRQLRKLSDDPNDFEIELEVTGKDLCRVLGMNTDTDLRKSRETQIKQNRITPSRSPSPKKTTFNSSPIDLNNQQLKFRVNEKQMNEKKLDRLVFLVNLLIPIDTLIQSINIVRKYHLKKSSPGRECITRESSNREIKKGNNRKPNYYKDPQASTSGVKHPASAWVKPNKNMY